MVHGTGSFTYFLGREDGHVVVYVAGELDMATAPELAECLARLHANGESVVVVDVDQLRFLDSSGLHVLVRAQHRAHARGGAVVVRSPHGMVQRLLAWTNLDGVLGVHQDESA